MRSAAAAHVVTWKGGRALRRDGGVGLIGAAARRSTPDVGEHVMGGRARGTVELVVCDAAASIHRRRYRRLVVDAPDPVASFAERLVRCD